MGFYTNNKFDLHSAKTSDRKQVLLSALAKKINNTNITRNKTTIATTHYNLDNSLYNYAFLDKDVFSGC